jgi:S1-C subfamily serine protease
MRAKFLSTLRIVIVFWTISLLGNQAFALDTKRLFKDTVDSVVLIMSFDSNNQPLAIGSGFFVDGGRKIVTNFHVIAGAASVQTKLTNGNVLTLDTILGIDTDHDLVILESPSKGLPLILSSRIPEIGEDIIAIGNPKGLEGTLSTGIVSGLRNDKGSEYYQVTAPISPGSSGGPIVNEKGEVLGVSTFYVSGGQNLNFAMPSAYINKLLRSPRRLEIADNTKTQTTKRLNQVEKSVKIIDGKVGLVGGIFSASILNLSNYPIKNIRYIATFYGGSSRHPLHFILKNFSDLIPPNLAKRIKNFDDVVESDWVVKYRVLDYENVSQPSNGGLIPTFD